ncbi:cytochrome P450 [Solimonas soli]|uniref:cytochrome P450 n=1 Tax=Solimonas soli TaxID=413479 RepID=UPI0004880EBF|nr:cytochrome P450 [Solimonas soli]
MNDFSQPAAMAPLPPNVRPEQVHEHPLRIGLTSFDHPYETLVPALAAGPEVYYSLDGYPFNRPMWVFRTLADMTAIYQDTEHFSSKDFAPHAKSVGDSWSQIPAETDPPMHGRYRVMLNPLFTPVRIAAMEAHVRDCARHYIAQFKDRGECDFMEEMAMKFPIRVFLELAGLPLDQVDTFLEWESKLIRPHSMEELADGTRRVKHYLLGVIEQRKRDPSGPDLISHALRAEVDGRKLDDDEMLGFCFNLFIGGLDTVATNMGWHFRHLAEHPEHQAELRAHPERIPAAVEELLRAYAAVTTFRTCIKPITLHGVDLLPGDKVALVTALGNRDPQAFEAPHEVRLDRKPRHLSFASGPHRCLGAPLARRELVIAMEEMLKTLPPFRIRPGARIESTIGPVIQPLTLPLVW